MSRSQKHTPISGITTCSSEKPDKQAANRLLRRTVKRLYSSGKEIEFWPRLQEVSDEWLFGKDGKQWFGESEEGKKLLRK